MSVTIFPQNGDTGDETNFQDVNILSTFPHVQDENAFEVTVDSGLDVRVASGKAFIGGAIYEMTTNTTLTLPDNTSVFIVAEVSRSSGLIESPVSDSDLFTVSTSEVELSPDVLYLAAVQTSSGSIVEIRDLRWTSPSFRMWPKHTIAKDSVTSSTTLTDATNKTPLPVIGGEFDSYLFNLRFFISEGGGGFKLKLRTPLIGSVGDIFYTWRIYQMSGTASLAGAGTGSMVTTLSQAGSGDNWLVVIEGEMETTPYALLPQIAQNSSNASATDLEWKFSQMEGKYQPGGSYF